MKRSLVAVVAALLVLSACGSDHSPKPEPAASPSPQPSATPAPTASSTEPTAAPAGLVVVPGAIGPVRADMSKAEALKTGFSTPTSRRRSRAVTRSRCSGRRSSRASTC